MIDLLPLSTTDPAELETLLDAAFGTDRRARTAYRLREGVAAIPALSFVAVDHGALVGSLQSWPVELIDDGDSAHPLVLVGPIAVHPAHQRRGIGKRLTAHALAAADAIGEDALMLIGDPEYYHRFFDFAAAATAGWALPGPVERHRLLARLRGGRTLPATGMIRARLPALAALR